MLLGPQRNVILTALLQIIRDGLEETYVCCACLLNLSKLQDGRLALISFEPPNSHITNNDLLRNPHSLLQTIEFSLSRYSELYSHTTVHAKTTTTVQGLAVHHIVGMLLHLTNDLPEVALLVCQTQIPKLIAFLISKSNKPLCKWTSGCLEDLSLALLVHVTSDPNCTKTLLLSSDRIGSSLERLSQQKGIHGLRAATIICQLSSCESM